MMPILNIWKIKITNLDSINKRWIKCLTKRNTPKRLSMQKRKSLLLALSNKDFNNCSMVLLKLISWLKKVSLKAIETNSSHTKKDLCKISSTRHSPWEWLFKTYVSKSVAIQLVWCSSTSSKPIFIDISLSTRITLHLLLKTINQTPKAHKMTKLWKC